MSVVKTFFLVTFCTASSGGQPALVAGISEINLQTSRVRSTCRTRVQNYDFFFEKVGMILQVSHKI